MKNVVVYFYGDFDANKLKTLKRYVIAYGG